MAGGEDVIVRLTTRVALPLPFVVFVKEMVSLYVPAARVLALLLMETVTVAEAPGATLPLLADNVTQL